LDFFAASPELRSPAAARAVQGQFGKDVASLILKADCGPLPDSLHGQAMQLLATLQKPLPAQAPGCMRTDAWSDLQLWTQLGAWAEQRHTWALHSKMTVSYYGSIRPPTGTVAPYPEFFSGLAKLARQTATAFEKVGEEQPFDAKTAAAELLDALRFSKEMSRTRDEKQYKRLSVKMEQLRQFQNRYYELHVAGMETNGASDVNEQTRRIDQMEKDLEDVAQRCATSGQATESETKTLRLFYDCRESVIRLLDDFAPVCERLAALATKSLNGDAFTEDDVRWIENYGVTLAGFHFYYGNSYEEPRDDFPIVTRIFSSPLTDSMLYAGLARPQALYLVIPNGKSLQLYRGAVMTYREFVRPNTQLLDDDSWREIVSKGAIPPAPPFTQSFYAEMSVGDLLKLLHAQCQDEDEHYHNLEDTAWQMNSRATDKDVPELLEAMLNTPDDPAGYWVGYIGQVIGHLSWKSQQGRIIGLLSSPDKTLASVAAGILMEQPAALDTSLLMADFARQPQQTRRFCCALLSHVPQPPETARPLFLQALQDPSAGVRWQGVFALEKSGQSDLRSQSALAESLNDTNVFVAWAAAHALGNLRATNSAPLMFAKLKTVVQATNLSAEILKQQLSEINGNLGDRDYHAAALLDPDGLTMRLELDWATHDRQLSSRRMPPLGVELPSHDFNPAKTLIEALADLGYTPAVNELFQLRGGENDTEATRALNKLAPDQLAAKLLATATDKQTDSYLREQAMVTLCEISATNRVRELVPLLDDTTPIEYDRPMRGAEWRVCDRAAQTIGVLLGWQTRRMPFVVHADERDAQLTRAREWAKQLPPKS
jgi:HEAT repeat protein